MTVRTTRASVLFNAPFTLPGFEHPLAAGRYQIETEEAAFEGNSRTVYRRVATSLRIETAGRVEHHPVDPGDLDSAIKQDKDAFHLRSFAAEPSVSITDEPSPLTRSWFSIRWWTGRERGKSKS